MTIVGLGGEKSNNRFWPVAWAGIIHLHNQRIKPICMDFFVIPQVNPMIRKGTEKGIDSNIQVTIVNHRIKNGAQKIND